MQDIKRLLPAKLIHKKMRRLRQYLYFCTSNAASVLLHYLKKMKRLLPAHLIPASPSLRSFSTSSRDNVCVPGGAQAAGVLSAAPPPPVTPPLPVSPSTSPAARAAGVKQVL
jgi:hypothetical protein